MNRRILLLVTDLEIGGTPTVVRELAVRLHRPDQGVHAEVACLAKWGPVADEIRGAGVAVTSLDAANARDLRVFRRLIRLVRGRRIDTVFSFLIHANAVAAVAKPFCRGVRFYQSIQTTQPRPAWHWRLQRIVHRAASRIVVPSESVATAAREWSGVPSEKLVVIPNAVDPELFDPSPVPAADPRPYPVGFIGRLDPIKQVDVLLWELRRLQQDAPGIAHLLIFGDGPMRVPLTAAAQALRLVDRIVTFEGHVARPQTALSKIGLLVLRSKAEGFGLVLIEAMAAGVPVVATNVPGIRDVVRHEETGLLADPTAPLGVVHAIRRIIEDRDLRERLVRNGLNEVRQRFSWAIVLPQYRSLLGLDV